MKHTKQRWLAALLALCLLLSLTAPAMAAQPESGTDTETVLSAEETPAEDTESGAGEIPAPEEPAPEETEAADIPQTLAAAGTEMTAERRGGYDVATVHYTDASGTEQAIAFRETESGYAYTLPQGVSQTQVTVEYFSTARWDGAVDISWYDAAGTEFTLTTPAQLAGLAALVNGRTSAETSRWRIKGDTALLVSTRVDDVVLVGAGGGNVRGTVYYGSAAYDFSGKTVYLGCDMDMGGSDGVNWTPIGGKFPMAPDDPDDPMPIEAFFNGTLDGRGHRITNLYCDRYSAKHFSYSQAIGLVGYLGELYDGESAPSQAPTVRNLSVSGSIHGRRMVGGIVGRVGSISTGVRIESCANHAAVSSTDAKGVGGIVGAGWGKGFIINCYNTGSVSSTYACPAGGICGNNQGLNIYACYNVGTINTNGNQRGRGIGGHDSGTYTVADCYTLSGCDDDPGSNGWYVGSGTACTIDIGVWTKAQMQSQALADALNRSGGAYVYSAGGYPRLFWESGWPAGECQVTVTSGNGVTVTATPSGTVAKGTVVYLSHTMAAGSAFRYYTANGAALPGDYYTVTADVTLGAAAEGLVAGTLQLPESNIYTVTVTKTGTIYVDGAPQEVADYPVASGDPIYEGDKLTAAAVLREGQCPEDNDYAYTGRFTYTFRYDDGADTGKSTSLGTFTVARTDAPLVVTAAPLTMKKLWTQVADTGWYSAAGTEFTLTTARQLAGLALLVNNGTDTFAGKTVRLSGDIILRNDDGTHGTRLWDGIGRSNSFQGIFDGGGHTISQMTAGAGGSLTGNAALFMTCQGATIRDLTVEGTVTGGRAAGLVLDMKDTTVENCVVSAAVTATGSNRSSGGIAGIISGASTMRGCVNRYAVTGRDGVGGLAGRLEDGTIQDCANFGMVTGSGTSGGLGGLVGTAASGTLLRCANYGTVSGTNWYVGGVAGVLGGTSTKAAVRSCYNAAAVTGGHAGYDSAGVGGLAGRGNIYELANSFNCGAVAVGNGLKGTAGGALGSDLANSNSSRGSVWYLDTACGAAIGSGQSLSGISACTAEELAGSRVLSAVNGDGCFVQNGRGYPELKSVENGYTIRGQVSADGAVTVRLTQGDRLVAEIGTDGSFSFTVATNDGYRVTCAAEGLVSRSVAVPENADSSLGVIVLAAAGDVNMDGAVDVYDLQRVYEHAAGIDTLAEGYARLLADVNGSGSVTVQDVQRLYEQLTGAA